MTGSNIVDKFVSQFDEKERHIFSLSQRKIANTTVDQRKIIEQWLKHLLDDLFGNLNGENHRDANRARFYFLEYIVHSKDIVGSALWAKLLQENVNEYKWVHAYFHFIGWEKKPTDGYDIFNVTDELTKLIEETESNHSKKHQIGKEEKKLYQTLDKLCQTRYWASFHFFTIPEHFIVISKINHRRFLRDSIANKGDFESLENFSFRHLAKELEEPLFGGVLTWDESLPEGKMIRFETTNKKRGNAIIDHSRLHSECMTQYQNVLVLYFNGRHTREKLRAELELEIDPNEEEDERFHYKVLIHELQRFKKKVEESIEPLKNLLDEVQKTAFSASKLMTHRQIFASAAGNFYVSKEVANAALKSSQALLQRVLKMEMTTEKDLRYFSRKLNQFEKKLEFEKGLFIGEVNP